MKRISVVLAAALFLLTGCYGGDPNMAAKVGDVVITEQELDASWEAIRPLNLVSDRTQLFKVALVGLILDNIESPTVQAAVTEEDLESVYTELAVGEFSKQPDTADISRALGVYVLLQSIVSADDGLEVLEAVNAEIVSVSETVELNPRYGEWDPSNYTFSGSGALATPIPTAEAAG
ncbi:MAG: hypothetical protein LBR58_02195 [Propionibacteriaceae bacterium]|jgi:hypothetical protein|nr:hypothetical protein [Propionibacteriaceae bacterium]